MSNLAHSIIMQRGVAGLLFYPKPSAQKKSYARCTWIHFPTRTPKCTLASYKTIYTIARWWAIIFIQIFRGCKKAHIHSNINEMTIHIHQSGHEFSESSVDKVRLKSGVWCWSICYLIDNIFQKFKYGHRQGAISSDHLEISGTSWNS